MRRARLDGRRAGERLEALDVDADRDRRGVDARGADDQVDPVRGHAPRRSGSDQRLGRIDEIVPVARRVERDRVRRQDALEDLPPPGEHAKDLRRGERRVQEEVDPAGKPPVAQEARDQHQLVVVHPDPVGGLRARKHDVGEPAVDPHVALPVVAVEDAAPGEVVQHGPERPVAQPVVVARDVALAQRHAAQRHARGERHRAGLSEGLLDAACVGKRAPVPPDPQSAWARGEDRLERVDEPADVSAGRGGGGSEIVREAVRNDDRGGRAVGGAGTDERPLAGGCRDDAAAGHGS